MNDLDRLREWRVPDPPGVDVRDRALEKLEALFYAPTTPVRVRPARRRLGLRAAIALMVTVTLAAGVVVWAQRETDRRLDAVGRIHLPKGTLSGVPGGKLPATFLIVGSDSRAGTNDPAFGDPALQDGERADTMILLRVTKQGAGALWIPRDTFVDGTSPQRLNGELVYGPARLIGAIRAKFGISIDRYVEVRFRGFQRIVDALGGVSMMVEAPSRDLYSGLDIPAAGCASFDGKRALEWARSRHYEQYVDGRWQMIGTNADIGRIARQEQLVSAIRSRSRQRLAADPRALLRTVDAIIPNLRVDADMSRDDIVRVARTLFGLAPGSTSLGTMPFKAQTALRNGIAGLEPAPGTDLLVREFAVATDIDQIQVLRNQTVITGGTVDCK